MATETTSPALERARNRVYNGAESVAAKLDEAANTIRRDARRAAERPGAIVPGTTSEQDLVDNAIRAVMNMMPNLGLDRLVERMSTLATIEAEIAREASAFPTALLDEAVGVDGDHHKQWYLEEIARTLGHELPPYERGIAPERHGAQGAPRSLRSIIISSRSAIGKQRRNGSNFRTPASPSAAGFPGRAAQSHIGHDTSSPAR